MSENPLRDIQIILAELLPNPADARLVLANAGISQGRMNLEDPPNQRWQSILAECKKRKILKQLLVAAQAEYPESDDLRGAIKAWEDMQSTLTPTPTSAPVAEPKPEPSILVKSPDTQKMVPVVTIEEFNELDERIRAIQDDAGVMEHKIQDLEVRFLARDGKTNAKNDAFSTSGMGELRKQIENNARVIEGMAKWIRSMQETILHRLDDEAMIEDAKIIDTPDKPSAMELDEESARKLDEEKPNP